MRVEFTLTMRGLQFRYRYIDEVHINWTEELDEQTLVEISAQWIRTEKYLTSRIPGLVSVQSADLELQSH